MKNMKRMSLVLNLGKLVRFQRTNQARIAPTYDASLYVFSPKDAKKDIPEVDSPNQTVNDIRFTLENFPLTHNCFVKFLHRPRKNGTTENNETIHARIFLPHALLFAEIFIFFRVRGRLGKQKATWISKFGWLSQLVFVI